MNVEGFTLTDLSGENVAFKNGILKAFDNGMVSPISKNSSGQIQPHRPESFGKLSVMAPEVYESFFVSNKKYCPEKSIAWKIGAILFLLVTGRYPQQVTNNVNDNKMYLRQWFNKLQHGWKSPLVQDYITKSFPGV